jgi:hypothetical protein
MILLHLAYAGAGEADCLSDPFGAQLIVTEGEIDGLSCGGGRDASRHVRAQRGGA